MSDIKLSDITPKPGSIASGDSLTLTFTVDGDNGTAVQITYSLDDSNNIYFQPIAGVPIKTLLPLDNVKLVTPPAMQIVKKVSIVRVPPDEQHANTTAFDIQVYINDPVGQTDARALCTIAIP